jgi:methanogenic corrinoid protein MtbC1
VGELEVDRSAEQAPPDPELECAPDPTWNRVRAIVEGEILPKLVLTPYLGSAPPGPVDVCDDSALHPRFEEFMRLVRSDVSSGGEAWTLIEELVEAGTPIGSVYAGLLTPVARRMGALWEDDECHFTEVAMVCGRLQSIIRRIAARHHESPLGTGPRVLVSGLPGSHHTLGPLMVAESLAERGIDVSVGEPFISEMDPRDFQVVAISIALAGEIEVAEAYMEKLRARSPEVRIIVGGAAFREDPGLVTRIGADGWAEDASSAAHLVREISGNHG